MSNLKYKHTAYTSAQWASLNPVIVENEIVIESDTKRTKIGNGISTYNELEYADANSVGNSLGSIKPTDAAPTPARNGNYTFSIGGNKPAWLTAEAGVTTVKAGDGVAVVFTSPSTYTYTHVNMSSDFITIMGIEQARSQSTSKVPSSKLVDDELKKAKIDFNYLKQTNSILNQSVTLSQIGNWPNQKTLQLSYPLFSDSIIKLRHTSKINYASQWWAAGFSSWAGFQATLDYSISSLAVGTIINVRFLIRTNGLSGSSDSGRYRALKIGTSLILVTVANSETTVTTIGTWKLCETKHALTSDEIAYGKIDHLKFEYYASSTPSTDSLEIAGIEIYTGTPDISGLEFDYLSQSVKDLQDMQLAYADQFKFILPSKLYADGSRKRWFYIDSILSNYESLRKTDEVYSTVGTNMNFNGNVLQVATAGADFTFDLKIRSTSLLNHTSTEPATMLTRTQQVVHKTLATNTTKKVLTVADSFFGGGYGIYQYIVDFATADGNTIDFIGTRGDGNGNFGEAIPGWNGYMFRSRVDSPFRINGVDNDWVGYFNALGEVPDKILFFLGMNGGAGTDEQIIIDNYIRPNYPDIEIYVCTIPMGQKNRYNQDNMYINLDRRRRNLSIISKFENKEANKIYVIPTHASWNRTYHYIYANTDTMQYNTLGHDSLLPLATDHHPNADGAKSIAYTIYNQLMLLM